MRRSTSAQTLRTWRLSNPSISRHRSSPPMGINVLRCREAASSHATTRCSGKGWGMSGKCLAKSFPSTRLNSAVSPPGRDCSVTTPNPAYGLSGACLQISYPRLCSVRMCTSGSPASVCIRSDITSLAALLKTTHSIREGSTPPRTASTTRRVSTRVLPDPAGARVSTTPARGSRHLACSPASPGSGSGVRPAVPLPRPDRTERTLSIHAPGSPMTSLPLNRTTSRTPVDSASTLSHPVRSR